MDPSTGTAGLAGLAEGTEFEIGLLDIGAIPGLGTVRSATGVDIESEVLTKITGRLWLTQVDTTVNWKLPKPKFRCWCRCRIW